MRVVLNFIAAPHRVRRILFISTILISGCTSVFRVDPLLKYEYTQSALPWKQDRPKPIDLDTDDDYKIAKGLVGKEPDQPASGASSNVKTSLAAKVGEDDPRTIARASIQERTIKLSDAICEQHKGDIIGAAAGINLATNFGSTLFSAAAAVVTGTPAKNYAAGATVLNGTRTSISSEVYQGVLTGAIIRAINESRSKKLQEIGAKQLLGITKYSVDQAIIDAQDYHQKCSFYNGISVLAEDPRKRSSESREVIFTKAEKVRAEIALLGDAKGLGNSEKDVARAKLVQQLYSIYDKLNATD